MIWLLIWGSEDGNHILDSAKVFSEAPSGDRRTAFYREAVTAQSPGLPQPGKRTVTIFNGNAVATWFKGNKAEKPHF